MKCVDDCFFQVFDASRSSHEERGLKFKTIKDKDNTAGGRSSHEERGLKCISIFPRCLAPGRSSHEERGLKLQVAQNVLPRRRRSSHEERGLKSKIFNLWVYKILSLLA